MRLFLATTCLLVLAGGVAAQGTLVELPGPVAGGLSGFALCGAGDVDGDGLPDFAVGAPADSTAFAGAGAVRIHSGRTGALLRLFTGNGPNVHMGASVAAIGDLNGDGCTELALGVDAELTNGLATGAVRVVSGRTGALLLHLSGSAAGDIFGVSVAGAGDVNADGTPDIIVGAAFADPAGELSGAASVHSGVDGSRLHLFTGSVAGDRLGRSVSGTGDANGDGYADVLAGAIQGDTGPGYVRVYSGRDGSVLYSLAGSAPFDEFGYSSALIGDTDGDGSADLLVGARLADTNGLNSGSVSLISGVSGRLLHVFGGSGPNERLGQSVAALGDVDQDGRADLLAGASTSDLGAPDAGAAFGWSGATFAPLFAMAGSAAGDELGRSVAGLGDVNGDGVPDFAVGAWHADLGGPDSGSVTVVSPVCAAVTSYGAGCGGPSGPPTLSLEGCLTPGGAGTLSLGNAAPGALALLFLGASPAALPAGGGCELLVQPPAIEVLVALGPAGGLDASFELPILGGPLPAFVLQAFVQDATHPPGYSVSGGILVSP